MALRTAREVPALGLQYNTGDGTWWLRNAGDSVPGNLAFYGFAEHIREEGVAMIGVIHVLSSDDRRTSVGTLLVSRCEGSNGQLVDPTIITSNLGHPHKEPKRIRVGEPEGIIGRLEDRSDRVSAALRGVVMFDYGGMPDLELLGEHVRVLSGTTEHFMPQPLNEGETQAVHTELLTVPRFDFGGRLL